MTDVAVFHHRFKNYAGGERVADALAEALDADLYTLWVSEDCRERTDAEPLMQDRYSGIGRLRRSVKAESILRPVDVEAIDLSGYDTIVTSGDMAHCVLPTDGQRHVHYLHTPNRDYFVADEQRQLVSGRGRVLKTLLMQWQRNLDLSHAEHVDHWLCNSEFVAQRARDVYSVADDEITVCPPPIEWDQLGPLPGERDEYWLTLGRLVPDKRVGELLDAFADLDEELIVAGDGRTRDRLERRAPANVTFEGYVEERRKRELLRSAQGFAFAGARECFGMSVAEALAAGCPVVAADSGNMRHLVPEDGGYVVETQDLGSAIDTARKRTWDREAIRASARRFRRARFGERVRDTVLDGESVADSEEVPISI